MHVWGLVDDIDAIKSARQARQATTLVPARRPRLPELKPTARRSAGAVEPRTRPTSSTGKWKKLEAQMEPHNRKMELLRSEWMS